MLSRLQLPHTIFSDGAVHLIGSALAFLLLVLRIATSALALLLVNAHLGVDLRHLLLFLMAIIVCAAACVSTMGFSISNLIGGSPFFKIQNIASDSRK